MGKMQNISVNSPTEKQISFAFADTGGVQERIDELDARAASLSKEDILCKANKIRSDYGKPPFSFEEFWGESKEIENDEKKEPINP
ncbi:MAG: hypothetical protein LBH42_06965 [Treponema sp.]|nr:hypothetical protein [Treponema sp.]